MSAKAYVNPTIVSRDPKGSPNFLLAEDLSFVDARKVNNVTRVRSWWAPPKVTGPERAQELFALQMAVDFVECLSSSGQGFERDLLSKIVRAMPRRHGITEKTFLRFVAQYAGMCAGAMR